MPYKMGEKWRAHKMIHGKRRTKLFVRKADAVRWEADQSAEKWTPPATPSACSILDLCSDYLMDHKARLSASTWDEKRSCFKLFMAAVDPLAEARALTPADCAAFLGRQATARSGNAANKDRKNLAALWSWGVRFRALPRDNPFREVDKFKADRERRYVPPPEDMARVLATEAGEVRVFILTMLHTAARRGELLGLKWGDVDLDRLTIQLATRKRNGGSLERDTIPLTAELAAALREHRKGARGVFVFCDEAGQPYKYRQSLMTRVCKRAEVKRFTFHAIRHLSASMMSAAGVPLTTIQAVLRHQSATTTDRYLRRLVGVQTRLDDVFTEKEDQCRSSTTKP